MSNIKNILDSIIDSTDTSYPAKGMETREVGTSLNPETFDSNGFREKLSLYVLKDLVCAMMHDETKDLDNMIDESIMRHIHDDYKGTCYGYLTCARDRLKSPILGDIVQEIDDAVDDVTVNISNTKDPSEADKIDAKDILKNVDNYDDLRLMLKEKVSKKVIDDVANQITKSNDAPVFDKIDDKIESIEPSENSVNESVILRINEQIVSESYIQKNPISVEEGLNRAIVEYCIAELDFLTNTNPAVSIYSKYLR